MPDNDAVQDRPSLAEEVSKFQGFSTEDGVTTHKDESPDSMQAAAAARELADKQAAKAADTHAVDRELADKSDSGVQNNNTDDSKSDKAAKPGSRQLKFDEMADDDTLTVAEARKMASHRINQMRRANGDLERRLAALESRRGGVEEKDLTASADSSNVQGKGVPDPANYTYGAVDDAYLADLVDYRTDLALAKRDERREVAKQSARDKQSADALAQQVSEFSDLGAEKYDDFHEVVLEGASHGDWPLSDVVGPLLLESPSGTDIAYHLATHIGEARKLAKMSPAQQRLWFARQEAKFSPDSDAPPHNTESAKQTTPVKVSKAPAPPENKARGQDNSQPIDGATDDFKSFERLAMGR